MNVRRLLFFVTILSCAVLLGIGSYIAAYSSSYKDTDFSLLAASVVLVVVSTLVWSGIYGKSSPRVKKLDKRITYAVLIVCIAASWMWSFFVYRLDCGLFTGGGCKSGILSEELSISNSFFWLFFLIVPLVIGGVLTTMLRKKRQKS